jgi:hypothetical protein
MRMIKMGRKHLKMVGHSIELLSPILQNSDGSIIFDADILIFTDDGVYERPIMHGDPKTMKTIPYTFHFRRQKGEQTYLEKQKKTAGRTGNKKKQKKARRVK